jgi:hypothetical protein
VPCSAADISRYPPILALTWRMAHGGNVVWWINMSIIHNTIMVDSSVVYQHCILLHIIWGNIGIGMHIAHDTSYIMALSFHVSVRIDSTLIFWLDSCMRRIQTTYRFILTWRQITNAQNDAPLERGDRDEQNDVLFGMMWHAEHGEKGWKGAKRAAFSKKGHPFWSFWSVIHTWTAHNSFNIGI